MIDQEIFDTVVRHLIRQRKRSLGEDGCAYRGADGLRCAIGCLIPDEVYNPGMENRVVERLVANFPETRPFLRNGTRLTGRRVSLLMDLQTVHDTPDNWEKNGLGRLGRNALRAIAAAWKLSAAVLDE